MTSISLRATFIYLLIVGTVHGHTGATGIVKERMDSMKVMSKESKLVSDMFKGKSDFDYEVMASTANSFVFHGNQMSSHFPDTQESRNSKHSEALPAVWNQQIEFDTRVKRFVEKSEYFKNAVATTNDTKQLKDAFYDAAQECLGCHKKFRKPRR